jgi:hypothetical protein
VLAQKKSELLLNFPEVAQAAKFVTANNARGARAKNRF